MLHGLRPPFPAAACGRSRLAFLMAQDEKETAENRDKFKERFGDEPRREDLVVMVPKRVRCRRPARAGAPSAARVHVCMAQADSSRN